MLCVLVGLVGCKSRTDSLGHYQQQPRHCIAGTDRCHGFACVSDGIGDDKMKRHNPTHASKRAKPRINRTTRRHGQTHLIHIKLIEGTILSPNSSEHIRAVADGVASSHFVLAGQFAFIYAARVLSAVSRTEPRVM